MMNGLFTNIAKLGIKMRIYRAIQIADSETGELKDREILILELLKIQGSMSMTQLSHFFPGVKLSTLSTDIRKLRGLDLIDVKVDKKDMRIHLIELSDRGYDKVAELRAQNAKSYIPLAEAIGKNQADLDVLNRVVEKAIVLVEKEINKFAESKKIDRPSKDQFVQEQEYVSSL
jgi:DNA-binding MarR family transcriptional regulator